MNPVTSQTLLSHAWFGLIGLMLVLYVITDGFDLGVLRRLQGRRGKLPENVKAIDDIIMPEASRGVLKDLAYRLANAADLEKMNAKLPSGLLFYGPPGTGKTQAAMALAKQSGYAFLSIAGADIVARHSAWDAIVREAKDIRPCIVFLDEADGILRDRQYSNHGMLTEKILTTMDGAGGRVRDLLFIAATNYYDRIDTAAVRGGRFEVKIAFDVPSAADMHHYVSRALEKHEAAGFDIPLEVADTLADRLTGLSIADADADAAIQALIDGAAVRRHRDGSRTLTLADVEDAIVAVRGETSAI
jgi:transitional endoplasmic reticulum ATPase